MFHPHLHFVKLMHSVVLLLLRVVQKAVYGEVFYFVHCFLVSTTKSKWIFLQCSSFNLFLFSPHELNFFIAYFLLYITFFDHYFTHSIIVHILRLKKANLFPKHINSSFFLLEYIMLWIITCNYKLQEQPIIMIEMFFIYVHRVDSSQNTLVR